MILLFSGMQSSLSMVYDREMGNMRTLLVSPFPRWFLLVSKLLAGVIVSIAQVYVFLAIAWFWGVKAPPIGYLLVLPALFLAGLMLGALGLLPVVDDQAAREFRRRHELRDLPDVFRLAGALSAVAHPGIEPAALQDLPRQPVHLCRRADPLRLLRADRLDFARRSSPASRRCSSPAPSSPTILRAG